MAMIVRDWMIGSSSLDEELDLMRSKDKALCARAADVNTQIDAEEMEPGRKRKRQVGNWLKNVEELHDDVLRMEQEVEQGEFSSRKKLRRQILGLTKEIEDLMVEGNFSGGLTLYDHGSSGVALVTTGLKGALFQENLELILSCLADNSICRIGMYGLGGVGKTTLAMHIHNKLHESSKTISVIVYWVTVLQECTVAVLQRKIAKAAGVDKDLEGEDEIKSAAILSAALKKRKRVILFLDDMWKHFPVDKVGIPLGKDECKLIITTRLLDVCRRMECQRSIKVELLNENEAWELFSEKLGNFDDLSVEAKALTKLVTKKCAGLPLGILTIAGSLRGVDGVHEWSNTLEELSNCTRGHNDMQDYVFPLLELSYARLDDVKLQKCFLSCAFYPEDSKLQRGDLIDLWISDCLLEEIESRDKQLDKGHTFLNRLINASLLESLDSGGEFVKMHDLVRDMAIKIGKESHHYMIYPGLQLTKVPDLLEWTENLTKVSLISNYIGDIQVTVSPMCPHLSTLLLKDNPLKSIPDSFLLHLKGLRFLTITQAQIEKLPDCISDLENLSTLMVSSCSNLRYVPSVAKLVKLRELNLCHNILLKDVPLGVEGLTNLRSLNLSNCDALSVEFHQLTSGLFYIEDLVLGYGIKGINGNDLIKTRHLRRVEGCWMSDMSDFNNYIKSPHCRQLKNYQFIVGLYDHFSVGPNFDRRVHLYDYKLNQSRGTEGLMLPDSIQFLQLNSADISVRSLSDVLLECNGLTQLKVIWIQHCKGLQYVWSTSTPNVRFESLEEMNLSELANFNAIIEPGILFPAMYNLKKLTIEYCSKMKKLFTSSLVKHLQYLQVLELHVCPGLEEIIAHADYCDSAESRSTEAPADTNKYTDIVLELHVCPGLEEIIAHADYCDSAESRSTEAPADTNKYTDIVCFPKLRILKLFFLYDLVTVCSGGLFGSDHIEDITIINCPGIKKFPFFLPLLPNRQPTAPVCLRKIMVERTWWELLEWDDSQSPQSLQPFIMFSDDYS